MEILHYAVRFGLRGVRQNRGEGHDAQHGGCDRFTSNYPSATLTRLLPPSPLPPPTFPAPPPVPPQMLLGEPGGATGEPKKLGNIAPPIKSESENTIRQA